MIKNIVFDMGNVLIRFAPSEFVARYGLNEQESEILLQQIFRTPKWVCLDEGSLVEDELYEIVKVNIPEHLQKIADELIHKWDQPLLIMPGMEELCRELKDKGFGIYLLSNAGYRQHDYWDRIPASKYFDGTLISADIRVIKPDPEIYKRLFEKFSLTPEECLFVDDSIPNIEASRSLGMDGFVFKGDAEELRSWLKEKLKEN